MTITKKSCEGCGKLYRNLTKVRHKYLCYYCKRKVLAPIGVGGGRYYVPFEEAISKVYEVRGYKNLGDLRNYPKRNPSIQASCNFPAILVGHKFKIQLIK